MYESTASFCPAGQYVLLSKLGTAEALVVADKAGERFVAAAQALAAGDEATHQRWQQATEATAHLVEMQLTKSTKRGRWWSWPVYAGGTG